MKPGIHPEYSEITVTCACGEKFQTRSTRKGDLHVEICSACHPFFTGKQKLVDTAGRVEQFQKRAQAASSSAKVHESRKHKLAKKAEKKPAKAAKKTNTAKAAK